MKYAVLIYADERREQELSSDEWQALIDEHASFETRHHDAVIAAEALEPTTAARTIRLRGGEPVVLDGPFAETKEQLGGFFLIEAPTFDAAVTMARELPLADHGAIEVRPVLSM